MLSYLHGWLSVPDSEADLEVRMLRGVLKIQIEEESHVVE